MKNKKTFFNQIIKLIPTKISKDEKFIAKLISAAVADWMYRHYKIYVLFSNADETSLLFTPSLVMNKKEIDYFFNSLENTLQEGINKITIEFVKKYASKIIMKFKL